MKVTQLTAEELSIHLKEQMDKVINFDKYREGQRRGSPSSVINQSNRHSMKRRATKKKI